MDEPCCVPVDVPECELCVHLAAGVSAAAEALVDNGATYTFVSSALLELHKLPVDQVVDMQVTLADGFTVSSGSSCVVPLVVCD